MVLHTYIYIYIYIYIYLAIQLQEKLLATKFSYDKCNNLFYVLFHHLMTSYFRLMIVLAHISWTIDIKSCDFCISTTCAQKHNNTQPCRERFHRKVVVVRDGYQLSASLFRKHLEGEQSSMLTEIRYKINVVILEALHIIVP